MTPKQSRNSAVLIFSLIASLPIPAVLLVSRFLPDSLIGILGLKGTALFSVTLPELYQSAVAYGIISFLLGLVFSYVAVATLTLRRRSIHRNSVSARIQYILISAIFPVLLSLPLRFVYFLPPVVAALDVLAALFSFRKAAVYLEEYAKSGHGLRIEPGDHELNRDEASRGARIWLGRAGLLKLTVSAFLFTFILVARAGTVSDLMYLVAAILILAGISCILSAWSTYRAQGFMISGGYSLSKSLRFNLNWYFRRAVYFTVLSVLVYGTIANGNASAFLYLFPLTLLLLEIVDSSILPGTLGKTHPIEVPSDLKDSGKFERVRLREITRSNFSHTNAFVELFSGRSIFFTSDLRESLDSGEFESLILHERYHQIGMHPAKRLGLAILYFGTISNAILLLTGLHGPSILFGDIMAVPLLIFSAGFPPFAFRIMRKQEISSDLYAARILGDPGTVISALRKLDDLNLNMSPKKTSWYSRHPSMKERLEALTTI